MANWFSTDTFVSNVVAIIVAIIVLAMVAVPIITQASTMEGVAGTQLETILQVVPIFIVIGILLACIYMFMSKRGE